ncbi:MAG: ATP-dependent DNA helicase [Saprospiraceae bacterium]
MSAFTKDPMILSQEFHYILDELEKTDHHLFITGKAGTGKSTLLGLFTTTTNKKVIVLAPTGIAALHVGGQTIHSFFGFPPRILQKGDIKKRFNSKLYQNIEMIIIDEISMVRADILDNIDYALRLNRNNRLPFGGVQMVFMGDLFQLPPVVSSMEEKIYFQTVYNSPYFFNALVFEKPDFSMQTIELRKVYRQEERHFIRLLEAVRTNRMDYEDLEDLNVRHLPQFEPEEGYVTLTARNNIAEGLNERKINEIQAPFFSFFAQLTGNFDIRLVPTEQVLKLKLGAQVMFIRNDPEKRFYNGMIGKIVKLEAESIEVEIHDKNGKASIIEVTQSTWEIQKYKINEKDPNKLDSEIVGSFKQYPLKLAWAITIHKSQGKTFDKVIIDLGSGAFEHGQTYVALSRCRTLGGIVLKQKLRPQDVQTDERIVEFYEQNF